MGELCLQLAVILDALRGEPAVFDGLAYRAARLVLVPAVGEEALLGQLFDVGEARPEPIAGVPELDLAHARGVHEETTPGQPDELAMNRGVAAFAIAGAHLP